MTLLTRPNEALESAMYVRLRQYLSGLPLEHTKKQSQYEISSVLGPLWPENPQRMTAGACFELGTKTSLSVPANQDDICPEGVAEATVLQ